MGFTDIKNSKKVFLKSNFSDINWTFHTVLKNSIFWLFFCSNSYFSFHALNELEHLNHKMADCIDKIRLLNDPLFITLKVEQFMFYVCGQKLFFFQICTCAIYKNQTQNSHGQKKAKIAVLVNSVVLYLKDSKL